jgi:hypothetical protein
VAIEKGERDFLCLLTHFCVELNFTTNFKKVVDVLALVFDRHVQSNQNFRNENLTNEIGNAILDWFRLETESYLYLRLSENVTEAYGQQFSRYMHVAVFR